MLLKVRVPSRIQPCDPTEINDGLILGMLLLPAVISGLLGRLGVPNPGYQVKDVYLPLCPRFPLMLTPFLKYLLTFLTTMLLFGIQESGQCNLNCLSVYKTFKVINYNDSFIYIYIWPVFGHVHL